MAGAAERVRDWVRRYLVAELSGLAAALLATWLVASWLPGRLAVLAYAASLAETIGFYAGYLVTRYLREDIAGSPRRRLTVIMAAAVIEFGPAEIADTLLIRPAAVYLGTLGTGHWLIGVLIGKLAADLVFYALAILSYEVLVRRLLRRFRRGAGAAAGAPVVAPAVLPAVLPGGPRGPELVLDLDVVRDRYRRFRAALPGVEVHFAMKCNPDPPLLRALAEAGSGFEVASSTELATLAEIGVPPAAVIFSNPVKPWWHIRDAYAAGLTRFAADSETELAKIAEHAPGAAVYLRLAVDPTTSEVASEGKFGVPAAEVVRLLLLGRELGLQPWGVAFHVGSQMTEPTAWTGPLRAVATIMDRLRSAGVRLETVDIGGGFPADYGDPVPPIEAYGAVIGAGLAELPYPVQVLAEPGRGLVADAGRLETTVIGLAERAGRRWLHLDVGAFNDGMEALETGHRLVLPVRAERGGPGVPWVVTGPSCDSQDTLRFDALLPAELQVGDRVILGTAGAYTTAYASTFNGFPVPTIRYEQGAARSRELTAVSAACR